MNIHSINLLKYSAFAGGIVYGYTHLQTLTHFVQQRSILQEKQHYADLVEEAKLSYDTHKTRELSKLAKADNIKTVDPESIYYNADLLANWAVSKFGQ